MTRRDRCYLVGKRAGMLAHHQAARAWRMLAADIEAFGQADVPKFNQLLAAVRRSTIHSKHPK